MDHAPVIADFDNNGELDIFIIGGYGISSPPDYNHGRTYALTAGGGTGPGWAMFRHDLRHSACFEENQPPIAVDDYAYTIVNTSVVINVTSNDYDNDGTIDPTTVSIVNYPSNGSLNVDSITGNVTYSPDPGFNGSDTFQYTVDDDDGNTSNVATVYVIVYTDDMILIDIPLTIGWNQITIPVQNSFMASSLGENISGCSQVSYWNNSLGMYQDWLVDYPVPEDDFVVRRGMGVFVNVDQPSVWHGEG
jgi:hypothetical protein